MDKQYPIIVIVLIAVVAVIILLSAPRENITLSQMKSCQTADDCVAVGCGCTCSGCGGFSYEDIVNKDFVDQWYSQKGCQPAEVCPAVCCKPRTKVCENSVCMVKEACGDGMCSDFETTASCPQDCLVNAPCLSEGQNSTDPFAECCPGLEKSLFYRPDCNIINMTGGVCIDCGDGVCGAGENTCNCPQDCKGVENTSEVLTVREYNQKVKTGPESVRGFVTEKNTTMENKSYVILSDTPVVRGGMRNLDEDELVVYLADLEEFEVLGGYKMLVSSVGPKEAGLISCEKESDEILFQKDASWGPCPVYPGCYQNLSLYYSGKLEVVEEGSDNVTYLGVDIVQDVIRAIRDSGLLTEECSGPDVMDYGATYYINLDGVNRTIRFPGCEEELDAIEDILH